MGFYFTIFDKGQPNKIKIESRSGTLTLKMTSLILIGSHLQFKKKLHSLPQAIFFSHHIKCFFFHILLLHALDNMHDALLPQLIFHVTFNWVFSHGIFLPRCTVFSYTVLLNGDRLKGIQLLHRMWLITWCI